MVKYIIKFADGTFWYHYRASGPDIKKAWTFNKAAGADAHAKSIADSLPSSNYTIEPVTV